MREGRQGRRVRVLVRVRVSWELQYLYEYEYCDAGMDYGMIQGRHAGRQEATFQCHQKRVRRWSRARRDLLSNTVWYEVPNAHTLHRTRMCTSGNVLVLVFVLALGFRVRTRVLYVLALGFRVRTRVLYVLALGFRVRACVGI